VSPSTTRVTVATCTGPVGPNVGIGVDVGGGVGAGFGVDEIRTALERGAPTGVATRVGQAADTEQRGHSERGVLKEQHRLGLERLAAKRAKEGREPSQIAGRIWKHPANHRVCGEGRDQDIEGPLLLSFSQDAEGRVAHGDDLLVVSEVRPPDLGISGSRSKRYANLTPA
jgi:hypothetical protein